jgi:hypothetical protein
MLETNLRFNIAADRDVILCNIERSKNNNDFIAITGITSNLVPLFQFLELLTAAVLPLLPPFLCFHIITRFASQGFLFINTESNGALISVARTCLTCTVLVPLYLSQEPVSPVRFWCPYICRKSLSHLYGSGALISVARACLTCTVLVPLYLSQEPVSPVQFCVWPRTAWTATLSVWLSHSKNPYFWVRNESGTPEHL